VSDTYQELAERIRGEVPEIERMTHRALTSWEQAKEKSYEDVYLDSVASATLCGMYIR
jgi:hypothetical protein